MMQVGPNWKVGTSAPRASTSTGDYPTLYIDGTYGYATIADDSWVRWVVASFTAPVITGSLLLEGGINYLLLEGGVNKLSLE